MNCQKCKYQAEIDRLRAVCLACANGGPNCGLSNRGRSHVHIESAEDADRVTHGRIAPDFGAVAALKTPLGEVERERYLGLLRLFGSLSWDQAGLAAWLLSGRTLHEAAVARGTSDQAMHRLFARLASSGAAFSALASPGMGVGRGRKPSRALVQGELF